jgi:hypothetical protein
MGLDDYVIGKDYRCLRYHDTFRVFPKYTGTSWDYFDPMNKESLDKFFRIEPRKVFVDIDGTLTNEVEGFGEDIYAARTPKDSVISYVNSLYDKGYTIVLWTARHKEDAKVTRDWLDKNNVYFDDIIFRKPKFVMVIDDLSVNPNQIERLQCL